MAHPSDGGEATRPDDGTPLADWRNWLQRNRRAFIEQMQTMDVIDVLIERGSMDARLEAFEEIAACGRQRKTERARLLLDFLDRQTSEHFKDFLVALHETRFPGLVSLFSDDEKLTEAFSAIFPTPLVKTTNRSLSKFPAVAQLAGELRLRYRQLEATDPGAQTGQKPVPLDKLVVNISLLSTDQLDELCDSPGQRMPFTFNATSEKTAFSSIDLKNAFDKDGDGQPVRRQIATGCAGAGKTTAFTLKAPFEWAKEASDFWQQFSLFFCGSLNDTEWRDAKSLNEVFRLDEFGLTKTEQARVLTYIRSNSDKVLLVADSFEEAPQLDSSSLLWKVLSGKELPKLSILISSRPCKMASWLSKNLPFHQRLEVVGFTLEKITRYVNEYFSHKAQKADRLHSDLEKRPEVRSLMNTPMLANMICRLFEMGKALPSTHTEVYHSAVLSMLQQSAVRLLEDVSSSLLLAQPPGRLRDAVNNLSNLAFTGLLKKKTMFNQTELVEADCLGDALDLGFLSSSTAIVVRKENMYCFQHHTMLEFFAALYAVEQRLGDGVKQSVITLVNELGLDGDLSAFWWFVSGMLRGPMCEHLLEVISETVEKVKVQDGRRLFRLLLQCHLECNTELPDRGSTAVANLIKSFGLDLDKVRLTVTDIRAVSLSLHHYHAGVQYLRMRRCTISDDDMAELRPGLEKCTHLRALYLGQNRLSTQGMVGLSKVIEDNRETLTELNLPMNEADDSAMASLLPAIKTCSRLETLVIGDQTMTSSCSRGLSDILHHVHGPNFHRLGLFAPIGDDGLAQLRPALETYHHQSLREFSLYKPGVSLLMLSQLLPRLSNLEEFFLIGHDHVDNEGLHQLTSSLSRLELLKKLWLIDIGITWQQTVIVVKCLQHMPQMDVCVISSEKSTFLDGEDLATVMDNFPVTIKHVVKSESEDVKSLYSLREYLVTAGEQSLQVQIHFHDVGDKIAA